MPTVDDGFEPVAREDVTDERLVAGHLRALQREVRDGFDAIGRALTALTRIDERLVVIIDRQNDFERRLTALETRRPRARKAK